MANACLLTFSIVFEYAMEDDGKQITKRQVTHINSQPTPQSLERAVEIVTRALELTQVFQNPMAANRMLVQELTSEARFNRLVEDLEDTPILAGEIDRQGTPFDQAVLQRALVKQTEEADLPWQAYPEES